MKRETKFKEQLRAELLEKYPGSFVFYTDPSTQRSSPDLIFLHNDFWAALETKRGPESTYRPNQPYFVNRLNSMSYSAFIHPGNKKEILDELERAYRTSRSPRVS